MPLLSLTMSSPLFAGVYTARRPCREPFFTTVWVPSLSASVGGGHYARAAMAAVVHDAAFMLRGKPLANGTSAAYEAALRAAVKDCKLAAVPAWLRARPRVLARLADMLDGVGAREDAHARQLENLKKAGARVPARARRHSAPLRAPPTPAPPPSPASSATGQRSGPRSPRAVPARLAIDSPTAAAAATALPLPVHPVCFETLARFFSGDWDGDWDFDKENVVPESPVRAAESEESSSLPRTSPPMAYPPTTGASIVECM